MLPKTKRLDSECFETVFADGKTVSGNIGHLKVLTSGDCSGIACVAPQSDTDSVVQRTRIRRRGYGAVEVIINKVPEGAGIIWMLPAAAETVDFDTLVTSFSEMLEDIR